MIDDDGDGGSGGSEIHKISNKMKNKAQWWLFIKMIVMDIKITKKKS